MRVVPPLAEDHAGGAGKLHDGHHEPARLRGRGEGVEDYGADEASGQAEEQVGEQAIASGLDEGTSKPPAISPARAHAATMSNRIAPSLPCCRPETASRDRCSKYIT